MSPSQRGGVRRALAHKEFRRGLAAYGLGSAAVGVGIVVVSVALFRRGGTTGWGTIGVVARVAPFILFSALSGVVADRRNPARVLVVAFALQAGIAAVLAATVSDAPLLAVAAIGFLGTTCWTVAYPSMAALTPALLPHSDLPAGNGLLATVESLAWIAGPGLGGLLVTAFGLRPALAVQGGLALAAAGLGLALWRRPHLPPAAEEAGPDGWRSLWAGLRDGVIAVRSSAAARRPLALLVVTNLVYGALQVLMLVAAWKRLGMSEGGYGALCAGLAGGAFVALAFVGKVGRVARPLAPLALCVALSTGPVAALAVTTSPPVGVLLLGLSALGLVLVEVIALSILQRDVPTDRKAAVFGLLDSTTVGAILIGSLAVGPLIGAVGLEWALVVTGAVVPLGAILAVALPGARSGRSVGAADAQPAPTLELDVAVLAVSPGAAARSFYAGQA